jgi:hypothetical protein
MTDRIDDALVDLGTAVAFPPTPDLRRSVTARLAEPPARPGWYGRPSRRLAWVALVLVAILAIAAAAFLVVPGLRITWVPALPSVAADPLGARMALGAPIPVADAAGHQPGALGTADEAYAIGDDDIVTLLYAASAELPDLDGTGIGLLLQAIEGALDRDQVHKLVVEVGAIVQPVEVDGADGYWISGPPHLLRYFGPNGEERAEATRIVGDVLVWERDGTLYRIESGLGLEETRRIAETIGP